MYIRAGIEEEDHVLTLASPRYSEYIRVLRGSAVFSRDPFHHSGAGFNILDS
jgi:hypothetical protein